MSRRTRGLVLLAAAGACAVLAAVIAGGYGTSVAARYGELRPVVVARADLPARKRLKGEQLTRLLEVRRVPESFVPPDALRAASEAVGRAPAVAIPAGSYVVGSALRVPATRSSRALDLDRGRAPVEIAVSGAEALSLLDGDPAGARIDVVVTTEPGPGRSGRTRVAASGVRLLALRDVSGTDATPDVGPRRWIATLALTREQALELIEAESFARDIRLLPRAGRR